MESDTGRTNDDVAAGAGELSAFQVRGHRQRAASKDQRNRPSDDANSSRVRARGTPTSDVGPRSEPLAPLAPLGGAAASWPTSDVADSILVISVWGGRWSSGDRGERTIMWPPRRWRRWCWSAAPSSNSSLDYHHDDARTAENGFAAKRSVNKSAKVVLVRMQLTLERSEGGVPLGSALCGFDAGTFLNLNKIAHSAPMVDKWDNRAAVTIPTRIKRGLIVHHCALNKRDPNRSRGLPVSAGYLARETLILRRPNGCEDWSGQRHST